MNRQTQLYLPFAIGAAVLIWLVWKNWPKTNARQEELDQLLDDFKTKDTVQEATIEALTARLDELSGATGAGDPERPTPPQSSVNETSRTG